MIRDGSASPGTSERSRWFMDELGVALLGDHTDPVVREEAARAALRNSCKSFERLVATRCAPIDVVCAELIVTRPNGHECRAVYRAVPSPVELLFLCAQTCFDGDEVTLRQVTAQSGTVTARERWPFGLMCAEQMTIPATARMQAVAKGAARAKRRERGVGGRLVYAERRVVTQRVRIPRARVSRTESDTLLRVRSLRREWIVGVQRRG